MAESIETETAAEEGPGGGGAEATPRPADSYGPEVSAERSEATVQVAHGPAFLCGRREFHVKTPEKG